MTLPPPPPALTKRQFDEAIKNGATTIREIDAALAKWCDEADRYNKIYAIMLTVTCIAIVAILSFFMLKGLIYA